MTQTELDESYRSRTEEIKQKIEKAKAELFDLQNWYFNESVKLNTQTEVKKESVNDADK